MATKKESFINEVIALAKLAGSTPDKLFTPDALDFWNGLNVTSDPDKKPFTENGKLVLKYMQQNVDTYNNLFKAKDIGAGLGISSRTASGAMRKLVSDGYVEKVGTDPIIYAITEKGKNVNLDAVEG